MNQEQKPQPGDRIVVRTPDQREFRGWLLSIEERGEQQVAKVKLDTGWQTTFPLRLVSLEP